MRYTLAFEIAALAINDARLMGMCFKDGAVREVALAMSNSMGIDEAKHACKLMMNAMRISINPKWDGSIA